MVMSMKAESKEKREKTGTILMDAPEHDTMEELAKMAGGDLTEETRELERKWMLHCVQLVPKEQRSAAMRVPATSREERAELQRMTREEKDAKIIANTAERLQRLPIGAKVIYTDGGGSDDKAGWGVCVTRKTQSWTPTCSPMVDDELFGEVCLDVESMFYAQATKHSNNSAELTGLLQAIIYLEQEPLEEMAEEETEEAIICSDSKYAMGCAEGTLNGEENLALYLLVRERYEREKERRNSLLELLHVKGHSGDQGNDHADCLAWWGKRPGPHSQLRVTDGAESEEEENERERDRLDAKIERQRAEESLETSDPDYEHLVRVGRELTTEDVEDT